MRDYFSQLFDTSELPSFSKVMDFGEEPTEYLSSCPQISLFLIIYQENFSVQQKNLLQKIISDQNTELWNTLPTDTFIKHNPYS